METFWFFQKWYCRAYDFAYESNFRFSLGHKLSYDSNLNSIPSEIQAMPTKQDLGTS